MLALVLLATRPLEPHRVGDAPNTIRVLFIGNSYTYVNNLPGLIIELAAYEPRPLDAEMIVEGGATLANHWTEGKALAAIRRGHWEYVVLQEQSTLGSGIVINDIDQIGDPANFYVAVRRFDAEIRKGGARTVLFLTWARQNAPQNQTLLTQAYTNIARELHVVVSPVGPAWQVARITDSSLALHQSDGSHPTSTGSYLAACVFYATFYRKSPIGLPAHVSSRLVDDSGNLQVGEADLNPADALLLQQIAWQVVSLQQPF
ncbi:MAG TPA: hypothetical protein VMT34_12895 [Aggregatilineales bacterium]|nr:hypothetical protein [Aggregatilineales bacterium]